MKENAVANYSRSDDVKKKRPTTPAESQAVVEQDLALPAKLRDAV